MNHGLVGDDPEGGLGKAIGRNARQNGQALLVQALPGNGLRRSVHADIGGRS